MTTKKNLVKMMLMSIATAVSFTFNACSNDDLPVANVRNDGAMSPANAPSADAKTVLIYLAGGNDLTTVLKENLRDCKEGSKRLRDNENLIVFARFRKERESWVARLKNGEVTDSVSFSFLLTLYPYTIAIKASNSLAFGMRLRKTHGFCKKDGSKRYNFENYFISLCHRSEKWTMTSESSILGCKKAHILCG